MQLVRRSVNGAANGLLDTKSPIQTTILSRRWTSVWKYVHVLTFDLYSFSSGKSFEQHGNRVLLLRSDSSSISMIEASFVSGPTEPMDLSDRIAKYAASNGVRELKIRPLGGYFMDVFELVYACYQSLQVLELEFASFRDAYHEMAID
ncbi:hypothetical protein LINGRAHAP2_LOCUS17051 [Linum grandiflorum]